MLAPQGWTFFVLSGTLIVPSTQQGGPWHLEDLVLHRRTARIIYSKIPTNQVIGTSLSGYLLVITLHGST